VEKVKQLQAFFEMNRESPYYRPLLPLWAILKQQTSNVVRIVNLHSLKEGKLPLAPEMPADADFVHN
jgi:hypothetical protein